MVFGELKELLVQKVDVEVDLVNDDFEMQCFDRVQVVVFYCWNVEN